MERDGKRCYTVVKSLKPPQKRTTFWISRQTKTVNLTIPPISFLFQRYLRLPHFGLSDFCQNVPTKIINNTVFPPPSLF